MRLVINKNDKDIFDAIADGSKKVETRANTVKYKNIKVGDNIIFSCGTKTIQKTVSKVSIFPTLDALLKKYKPNEINPRLSSKEEIVKMYNSFPGYTEKIKSSGIIAFDLE